MQQTFSCLPSHKLLNIVNPALRTLVIWVLSVTEYFISEYLTKAANDLLNVLSNTQSTSLSRNWQKQSVQSKVVHSNVVFQQQYFKKVILVPDYGNWSWKSWD